MVVVKEINTSTFSLHLPLVILNTYSLLLTTTSHPYPLPGRWRTWLGQCSWGVGWRFIRTRPGQHEIPQQQPGSSSSPSEQRSTIITEFRIARTRGRGPGYWLWTWWVWAEARRTNELCITITRRRMIREERELWQLNCNSWWIHQWTLKSSFSFTAATAKGCCNECQRMGTTKWLFTEWLTGVAWGRRFTFCCSVRGWVVSVVPSSVARCWWWFCWRINPTLLA